MAPLRSVTTRATRSTSKASSLRPSPYVTSHLNNSRFMSGPHVHNACRATEEDRAKYPRFEDLEERWKKTIDELHRLKNSAKLASLKNFKFDQATFSMGRIEAACDKLGIDGSIFDLHMCITNDGKKICFCFACLYDGPGIEPRSYSLGNISKNMDRHPNSDSHCRVVGKLLDIGWDCLIKKLKCPHPACLFSVNAARDDQYNKHIERAHAEDDNEALLSPTESDIHSTPASSPALSSASMSSLSTSSVSPSPCHTPILLNASPPNSTGDFNFSNQASQAPPGDSGVFDSRYRSPQLSELSSSFDLDGSDNYGSYIPDRSSQPVHWPPIPPFDAITSIAEAPSADCPFDEHFDWNKGSLCMQRPAQRVSAHNALTGFDGYIPSDSAFRTTLGPMVYEPSLDLGVFDWALFSEVQVSA